MNTKLAKKIVAILNEVNMFTLYHQGKRGTHPIIYASNLRGRLFIQDVAATLTPDILQQVALHPCSQHEMVDGEQGDLLNAYVKIIVL